MPQPLKRLSNIDDAKHPNESGLYQRDFTKARLLVNPESKPSGPITLEREFYDPDAASLVREVRLAPLSAKILLLPVSNGKLPLRLNRQRLEISVKSK